MSTHMDVPTMIRQLTTPTRHGERFTLEHATNDGTLITSQETHATWSPSLLDQLRTSVEQSSATENGQRPGFTSKPPARIEAIDAYNRIDREARTLVAALNEDNRRDAAACILKLGGLYPNQDRCRELTREGRTVVCCGQHKIEAGVQSWWSTARVFSGWDKPPWAPDNTCPGCGKKGTLRVRILELDDALATGSCTNEECHRTWSPYEIGLLAEHIRAENLEHEEAS